MTKLLRFFRPSHQHTAFSATLLLISAVMLSRVIGYARDAYIAWAYGAGGTNRRLRGGVHPARFPELHCGRRRGLDHLHFDLHPLSGREARGRRAEDIFHHHHGHDRGHDRRNNPDRDFRAAICALVRQRIFARQDRPVRSPHPHSACRRRFSFTWAAWFRPCCSRTGCSCFPRSGR
jgi:hypothetical protein